MKIWLWKCESLLDTNADPDQFLEKAFCLKTPTSSVEIENEGLTVFLDKWNFFLLLIIIFLSDKNLKPHGKTL